MYPDGQEVLVVIADHERRTQVTQTLRNEGFAVTTAAEGRTALRAIGARRYALIIAARHLPGSLDGPTTVRQARIRQPWLKALYVENQGQRPILGNPERDEVIAAPFERHELIGCIFELLQRDATDIADLSRRARTDLRAS